jgi:FAD/FMN-containing dehydrogenase
MLADDLKKLVKGSVAVDAGTLGLMSRDASLFEVQPSAVVFPKDEADVIATVRYVAEHKAAHPELSVTARSAGTDMTGGPLSESIVLECTSHLNRILETGEGYAIAEPGVFYRDLEEETMRNGYLLPSYPASRELCAVGGVVNNNSGGEKSLVYGKTVDYVEELRMVLADGVAHDVKKLTEPELQVKMNGKGFEGDAYRGLYTLITENEKTIQTAKPAVSKNSSGYALWDVWDPAAKTFDLTRLFSGAQGTLGIMTRVKLRLAKMKPYSGMLVVFLDDLAPLARIVNAVLPFKPTSFESFDDHTLRLALRFLPGFLKLLGAKNLVSLAFQFLPEMKMVMLHGMPKLIVMIEFEEETQEEVYRKLRELYAALRKEPVRLRIAKTEKESRKYWAIRRESFNLLRNKIADKQTVPFIDDLVVLPENLPGFLPKLYAILDRYGFLYTITGHVGNGNFHIIPLMKLADERERAKIPEAANEVFDLILSYHGSLTGEHNDGLIRSPYLRKEFGDEMCRLFEETKRILDPQNIFNPGKKVGASLDYTLAHLRKG